MVEYPYSSKNFPQERYAQPVTIVPGFSSPPPPQFHPYLYLFVPPVIRFIAVFLSNAGVRSEICKELWKSYTILL